MKNYYIYIYIVKATLTSALGNANSVFETIC